MRPIGITPFLNENNTYLNLKANFWTGVDVFALPPRCNRLANFLKIRRGILRFVLILQPVLRKACVRLLGVRQCYGLLQTSN